MSHFYGSLKGSRGEATRQGTRASGITSHTRGWHLGVRVDMTEHNGQDEATITLTGGSSGELGARLLVTFVRTPDGWVVLTTNPDARLAWHKILAAAGVPL